MFQRIQTYFKNLQKKHALALVSMVVGIVAGLLAVALKSLVSGIQFLLVLGSDFGGLKWWYVLYPIFGLSFVWFLVHKVFKFNPGSGIPVVLQAISKRRSKLKKKQVLTTFFSSAVTVGFGGSAGLEGPTVQVASAVASWLSSYWKLDYKTRTMLLACAAAGSMAAIFKAPIAAIVFAVEVIMIDLTAMSMVPLLMASLSAFLTTYLFLGNGQIIQLSLRTGFELKHLHHYILLGVLCGFGSVYFTRIYLLVIKVIGNLKSSRKQILIAGVGLGLIFMLFPALYGEGYDIINSFLKGSVYAVSQNSMLEDLTNNASLTVLFLLAILLMKAVATGMTMGAGGIGGIFAPTLFMGSALGMIYSRIWNAFTAASIPVSNVVLVAMAGLVAGVLHAPLTSIFLIAELSGGYSLFVPLMISSGVAFYISKGLNKHNIYTMELAQRGELITHDKDQAVLTLMSLSEEIETNFSPVFPHQKLRELIDIIAASKRNLFPVINEHNKLVGVIGLDDMREHMFNQEKYDEYTAADFMVAPSITINYSDKMDDVMNKFDKSNAWNIPVIKDDQYMGFVSKSKLFSAYRGRLKETSL